MLLEWNVFTCLPGKTQQIMNIIPNEPYFDKPKK